MDLLKVEDERLCIGRGWDPKGPDVGGCDPAAGLAKGLASLGALVWGLLGGSGGR